MKYNLLAELESRYGKKHAMKIYYLLKDIVVKPGVLKHSDNRYTIDIKDKNLNGRLFLRNDGDAYISGYIEGPNFRMEIDETNEHTFFVRIITSDGIYEYTGKEKIKYSTETYEINHHQYSKVESREISGDLSYYDTETSNYIANKNVIHPLQVHSPLKKFLRSDGIEPDISVVDAGIPDNIKNDEFGLSKLAGRQLAMMGKYPELIDTAKRTQAAEGPTL